MCVLLFLLVLDGGMWDLIALIPDHCLSFFLVILDKFGIIVYFTEMKDFYEYELKKVGRKSLHRLHKGCHIIQ